MPPAQLQSPLCGWQTPSVQAYSAGHGWFRSQAGRQVPAVHDPPAPQSLPVAHGWHDKLAAATQAPCTATKNGAQPVKVQIALPSLTEQTPLPLAMSQGWSQAPQCTGLARTPSTFQSSSVLPSQSSSWPLQVSALAVAVQPRPTAGLQVVTPWHNGPAARLHGWPPRPSSVLPSQSSSRPLQLSGAGGLAAQGLQPLGPQVWLPLQAPGPVPQVRVWPALAAVQLQLPPSGWHDNAPLLSARQA
jgi:hypothetical protein